MKIVGHERFKSVYWIEFDNGSKKLATENLAPGVQVYGEKLVKLEGREYRTWDPYRSKLAASILKNIKKVPVESGKLVLYLGAASGTTPSHVSDIVGLEGCVYCVEISPRPFRDLLSVCEKRANMTPILADARHPSNYSVLLEKVDVIYQDIAQPDQTDIFLANGRAFLKEGGYALLVLKARSIDVTKEPWEIFRNEIEKLEKEMELLDAKILDPYEKDHAMLVLRK
ncbi:MAG: fibrillarin-like rRNA/tRNA 2'-O-methyltransferase [Hadesarchaea archaeon]|nr:MAG: fibrillarin-like rRNA/tRNA 2'-O-methyltransferase [Hadesarchaea archaeon]HDI12679.1 fibrillarin-like rRNA/tRNA 2'-O-methyltransferase [Hadesarchaea archaeon]